MRASQFCNQRIPFFIGQDHADYGVRFRADAILHFALPSRERQVA